MQTVTPTHTARQVAPIAFLREGWVVGLLLFVVAFIPAALPHPVFTIDETRSWERRSVIFRAAMQNNNPENTIITHHPGVLTMWLGWAGLTLESQFNPDGTMPDARRMYYIRVPAALYNALGVVLGYWLLRRLFGEPIAGFAGLLWATDPWLTAHSGILHIDALSTTSATLALLAILLAARGQRGVGWWIAAGIFTGLAALAKFTLFFMCGMVPVAVWLHTRNLSWRPRLIQLIWTTALVTLSAVVIFVALYPGVPADPGRFIDMTLNGITNVALSPHENGNFFWGRIVPDPGPLFYPVALMFRLTPWVIAGLLVLPFFWRSHTVEKRRTLLTMLTFILLFTLFMVVQDKKFDRYVLPVFPTAAILAAAGLLPLFRRWTKRNVLLRVAVGVVAIAQLAAYYPNGLAYYNPLVGGGPVAQRIFLIGWGEGYAEAVNFIQDREEKTCVTIAASDTKILQRHLPRDCATATVDYAPGVAYVSPEVQYWLLETNHLQREPNLEQLLASVEPVHRVSLFGADYIQVYATNDLP
jgi:hypothetical protein